MGAINLADAAARLSELVHCAEAGETIYICRHGTPPARITAMDASRKLIDKALIEAQTVTIPAQKWAATELVRSLRDQAGY